MFETSVLAKANVDHGLLFTGTDHAFNLASDPASTDATRAVTMPVDLADLKSGQNTLEMRTAGTSIQPPMVIANVELEVVPR